MMIKVCVCEQVEQILRVEMTSIQKQYYKYVADLCI